MRTARTVDATNPEHPPIQCLLELRCDGTVVVITKRGCTDLDVYQTLRLLADSKWNLDQADARSESNRTQGNRTQA